MRLQWRRQRGADPGVAPGRLRPAPVRRRPARSNRRRSLSSSCSFLTDTLSKDGYAVSEARLGGSNRDLENDRGFFNRQVVLIVKEQHRPAGGRHLVDGGEQPGLQRLRQRLGRGQTGNQIRIVV